MTTSTHTSQKQDKSSKLEIASSGSRTPSTENSTVNPATPQVNDEQRRQMIEVIAYYRAERRGYCEGGELDDWLAAEAEVGRQLLNQTDS